MKFDGSQAGAVLMGLVLVAAVAMYSWIVAPHVDYLRAVQNYEPVLDDIAREKDELQDLVVRRREMLDQINKKLDDLSGTLFTYAQARDLPQEFAAVAEQYGCWVTAVDLSDEPVSIFGAEMGDMSIIDAVEAEVSVVGDYNGLTAFVKRVQGRDRKIWINSLTIRMLDDEGGRLECHLAMTIYVIEEKEAPSND
ncbi:MAG: hypothetical protein IH892_06945 [Planctomycetes bacterium]|nr:hypothetical protein [Planctomycetota bacterium]